MILRFLRSHDGSLLYQIRSDAVPRVFDRVCFPGSDPRTVKRVTWRWDVDSAPFPTVEVEVSE